MYHDHFNKTTPSYRNMRDAPVTKAFKKAPKIRRRKRFKFSNGYFTHYMIENHSKVKM